MLHDIKLLEDSDVLDGLAELILSAWDKAVESRNAGSLADYILGDFETFVSELTDALDHDPRPHAADLTKYPGYVYLGIAKMALWEDEEDDEDEEDEDEPEFRRSSFFERRGWLFDDGERPRQRYSTIRRKISPKKSRY